MKPPVVPHGGHQAAPARILLLAFLALAASAARPAAAADPPLYSRADIDYGQRLYRAHCSTCHGAAGDAVAGVNFAAGFRNAASDRDLTRIVTAGIAGTPMPPGNYTTAELTGLVAYLRNIRGSTPETIAVGDEGRGRGVFEGKAACLTCHRVHGQGSRTAPDLSDIGVLRTAGALARTLVDPPAAMLPMNRSVRAVTRDGKVVKGRRLNEDTHTVQIIDDQERLVSLTKDELREYEPLGSSPMPSYAGSLTQEERADVLAYLLSLKGLTR